MGKKGSWLSAIKRVFVLNSKEKLEKGSDKKHTKEKKKGRGILKHGESKSFIPSLFREPSSIEKILEEADEHRLLFRPPTRSEQLKSPPSLLSRPSSPGNASRTVTSPRAASPRFTYPRATSPRVTSPKAASPTPRVTSPRAASLTPRVTSPRDASPRVTSPKVASPTQRITSPRVTSPRVTSPKASPPRVTSPKTAPQRVSLNRPEPTLRNQRLSATKIQAAYRGYKSRKSFRALRGLVRLRRVVGDRNVKRQTMSAMKHMQVLVRVQNQIQSRRIQMLDNKALQHQAYKNNKKDESSLHQLSEAGDQEDWDNSLLTKENVEARMRKRAEAIIKRERAIAYSHKLLKNNPESDKSTIMDIRSGGFSWWWTGLDRQLPSTKYSDNRTTNNVGQTPSRPTSRRATPEHNPSPRPQSRDYTQHNLVNEYVEALTPTSARSTATVGIRQMYSTPSRTPATNSSKLMKYSRTRHSPGVSLKDDDSLVSCPTFPVPNYMAPTISAKAKVRANNSNLKEEERFPGSEWKRRFSFPQITPSIKGWSKGWSGKDSTKHQPLHSIGDRSVDSTVSMPAAFGRKPFNRFV